MASLPDQVQNRKKGGWMRRKVIVVYKTLSSSSGVGMIVISNN